MSAASLNRRRFLQSSAALGAVTLGGGFSACGGTGASGNKVTINYWDSWVSQSKWVDNEIKLFQQVHPEIVIKKTTQASDKYDNLFALAARSNTIPDIFLLPQKPVLNEQVTEGWVQPLDKWADENWRKRFPEGTFHEGNNVFGGKLYSAPLNGPSAWLQLYINNEVFKNAGLVNSDGSIQLPRTWDDVTHAAETINKKSNNSVYGLGFGNGAWNVLIWWVELFVRGGGAVGGSYEPDYRVGKYTHGSDRAYSDFIELFLEWKKRGFIYPDSLSIGDEVARAYFERGKFGMTVGGVWNQPGWTKNNFTDYSLITLPSPEEKPRSYFYNHPGGAMMGISPETKHQDEAWAWFDWLHSKEAGKRYVEYGIALSIYPENNDPKNVKFKPFAQYVETQKYTIAGPDVLVRNPDVSHVVLNPVKPDMGDVMVGLYSGQLSNITDALRELEARSEQALSDAIKNAQDQGYNVSRDDYIFKDWDVLKPYHTKPKQA